MNSTFTSEELAVIAQAAALLDSRFSKGDVMRSAEVAGRYFKFKLQPKEREVFAVLFLDAQRRVITYEELFFGSISGCEVHPRVVLSRALANNAHSIMIAHNHPSGNSHPSAQDRAMTARLKHALQLVDINLLDHFVVGTGEATSMVSLGWL